MRKHTKKSSWPEKKQTPRTEKKKSPISPCLVKQKLEPCYWIWGKHAVLAALERSDNSLFIEQLLLTNNARKTWPENCTLPSKTKLVELSAFTELLGRDAVHQGVALKLRDTSDVHLEDLIKPGPQCLVALDQVVDPHNVGAILRSCAAFGITGMILPKDNAPKTCGSMAKSACGTLNITPRCYVTNLARSLEQMKKKGFWVAGLDENNHINLKKFEWPEKIILIMGSEGRGIRPSIHKICDYIISIPSSEAFSTLNVSNAAAICFYNWHTHKD